MAWAYGFPLSHWNPKPTNCYHKLWLIKHSFFQRKQYQLMCKKSAKYILSVLSFYWINSLSMLFPPPPLPPAGPRGPLFSFIIIIFTFFQKPNVFHLHIYLEHSHSGCYTTITFSLLKNYCICYSQNQQYAFFVQPSMR